jgi:hypothetical protein
MRLTKKKIAPYVHSEKKILNGVEVTITRTNIRTEPLSQEYLDAIEFLKRTSLWKKNRS